MSLRTEHQSITPRQRPHRLQVDQLLFSPNLGADQTAWCADTQTRRLLVDQDQGIPRGYHLANWLLRLSRILLSRGAGLKSPGRDRLQPCGSSPEYAVSAQASPDTEMVETDFHTVSISILNLLRPQSRGFFCEFLSSVLGPVAVGQDLHIIILRYKRWRLHAPYLQGLTGDGPPERMTSIYLCQVLRP